MPTPADDVLERALADLASRADQAAWEATWSELYKLLRPLVFASCFRVLRGDRDWADDVVQEVFFKLARSSSFLQIRDATYCRKYVLKVAHRTAIDYLRRLHGRGVPHEEHSLDLGPEPADPRADSAEMILEAKESIERLLTPLDETERKLVLLVLAGHSMRDLPDLMGLGYQAVANRLHQLRNKLRNIWLDQAL